MPKIIKALFAFKFVKLAGATQDSLVAFCRGEPIGPTEMARNDQSRTEYRTLDNSAFSRITFNILRRIKVQDFPVRELSM